MAGQVTNHCPVEHVRVADVESTALLVSEAGSAMKEGLKGWSAGRKESREVGNRVGRLPCDGVAGLNNMIRNLDMTDIRRTGWLGSGTYPNNLSLPYRMCANTSSRRPGGTGPKSG